MATRKKKAPSDATRKPSRSDLKQKIRELKKQRSTAGASSQKAKVGEYNEQLRVWRRKLRKAARHKAA